MEEIIEGLARECAEAMAVVETNAWGYDVVLCGVPVGNYRDEPQAKARAFGLRVEAAKAVAAALRRFARTPPWPSPVGEERLAQIAEKIDQWCITVSQEAPPRVREVAAVLVEQQAQIAHLTRLAQFLSAESEGQAYAAGFDAGRRAGAKEQRLLCERAAHAQVSADRPSLALVRAMLRAILDAPLAGDAAG